MKKKFSLYFLLILVSFISNHIAIAKPRCELLYENIYNDINRKDVNLAYIENKKTIGIRLSKIPDKDKKNFILEMTFIHGFLHLLGFDHKKIKDFKIMNKEENKILNSIS